MRGQEEATFAGNSRFQVRSRLGDGGGGVVYRALDKKSGIEVAIKVMRDSEGDGMARFRASFGALQKLVHPNLVRLIDLVDEGGHTLLAMELIEGIELLDYVRREAGGFDELRLRSAFAQLAQALRALHHERKVHRDVKPSNVRVTAEGRVVLLDLDLAMDLDAEPSQAELDQGQRPVGTAVYMAPEQATSQRAHPLSDWYSVGVVLYEALTGSLPYRGPDLEVLLAKQDGRPPPPSALAPNVPEDLDALCVDLLTPNPAERPSGAQVLRRLGVHEEVSAGRASLASMLAQRPPFIGREPELERLSAALERSRTRTMVVRITGEAGVGKSMLCEEFLRRLAHDPRRVLALSSSCPRFPDRPHAPVHEPLARITEALRQAQPAVRLPLGGSALRMLERAFPGSALGLEARPSGRTATAPDPLEQRFRTIAALKVIVAEVAAPRPLVLWIDNYHWADVDTQRLIGSLVQGPDAPHILLLLSEQTEGGTLELSGPPAHEVITLARLTPLESRQLAETLLERATGTSGELEPVLWRDGLPLMVQERVRHALFFGEKPDDGERLEQLIRRRVGELSKEARRVLSIVCAAHDPVPQEICERASELPRAEFSRQLSALRVGGLVRSMASTSEDYLLPQHQLVADCIDVELRGPERIAIHGRLAVALVARDPARASGRLLRHQGESGDHRAAAQSARVAAEQAHEALAFQRAAELFTLCASLDAPGQDEAGYQLLRRMADALGHAGWALQAATIYRQAALGAKAADALHMRQRAAEHLLRGAEVEAGLDAVRELLASIDLHLPTTPRRMLWPALAQRLKLGLRGLRFREVAEGQLSARDLRRVDVLWSSGVQLSLVDPVRGADFLAHGLSEALKVGEPNRVARALCSEAWSLGAGNDEGKRAREVLEVARELIERLNSPLLDGHLRLSHGMVAFAGYRLLECGTHCRDAERVLRDSCDDVVWEVTTAQTYQLLALALTARYDELSYKLSASLREAEERGDVWGHASFLSIGALSVKLARNLPNEAAEDVREAMSRWESPGREAGVPERLRAHPSTPRDFHFQHYLALLATTSIDLYRDNDAALDGLETRWSTLKSKLFLRGGFARTTLHELRARAYVLAARRRKDLSLLKNADADARVLARSGGRVGDAFSRFVRANVMAMRGQGERAAGELREGIALLEGQGLGLWVPAARAALGALEGGSAGSTLRADALRALRERSVVDAERYVAMMMPGFQ
jgi:serine/threonine protein kinase